MRRQSHSGIAPAAITGVLAATALLLMGMALAPGAGAATVAAEEFPGGLRFSAGPGETNDLTIESVAGRPNAVAFSDSSAPITPGEGCATVGAQTICEVKDLSVIFVALGDGDDTLDSTGLEKVPVNTNAGPGADTVRGGPGSGGIIGGSGNDLLAGGPGPDDLRGGSGRDMVMGELGRDQLRGGEGADRLFGGPSADLFAQGEIGRRSSGDLLDGGAGRDEADLLCTACAITLDRRPNDGRMGGTLDVRVEIVQVRSSTFDPDLAGETGAVTLYGSGDDVLNGDSKDNFLISSRGDDLLRGKGGRDSLFAGSGDDRVIAADAGRDLVDCGKGQDVAIIDRSDLVRGCERTYIEI